MIQRANDTVKIYNQDGKSMVIEKADLNDFIKLGFSVDKPAPAKRETIPEPEPEQIEETEDEEKPRRGRPAQKKR